MEETIDLNDYKEFINIEYLKSLKLQKETIKPSITNSKYFENDEEQRKFMKKYEEKISKLTPERLKEYREYLEYSGIPKELRYTPNKKNSSQIAEISEIHHNIKIIPFIPFNFDE